MGGKGRIVKGEEVRISGSGPTSSREAGQSSGAKEVQEEEE